MAATWVFGVEVLHLGEDVVAVSHFLGVSKIVFLFSLEKKILCEKYKNRSKYFVNLSKIVNFSVYKSRI